MTGTIRKIVIDRGFGFITPEDDPDQSVFFHFKDLRGAKMAELSGGDQVSFEVENGPKGLRGRNVRPS